MRFRDGSGHARQLAGLFFVALAITACSGQVPQPKEYGLGDEATVAPGSVQDFAATAGDVVHFQADSAVLNGEARGLLRKQARWLREHPHYRVIIEGHADERGTRTHHLALGAQRALTVKRFLVRNGVSAVRIHTVSYGNERPVAKCEEVSCRAQNRRVETVLKADTADRG